MKKGITLLFILSLVLSVFAQDRVVITTETFGDIVFGTNQHGADTNFDGTIDIECPADTPGYARHFDYDFVQDITDLGYSGFTSKNGNIISMSSDSSIQMNTYIGDDNQTWDNASKSVKLHLTPSSSYEGSWDSIMLADIAIDYLGVDFDSLAVAFGYQKRAGATWTWDSINRGFLAEVSIDGGAFESLDTNLLPSPLQDVWVYLEMPIAGDPTGAALVDIVIASTTNQFAVDDLSLIGYGTDLPIVDAITIAGTDTITTEGGTVSLTWSTESTPAALDTAVVWSIVEGTGCASIDEDGVVTAEGNGTVTAVATAYDGGGASDELELTLSNQTALVTGLTVASAGGLIISEDGGTLQFSATATPHCANDQTVAWSVDTADYASIDATGLLTALDNGQVYVKATANDGSGVADSVLITISGQTDTVPESIVDVNGVDITMSPNPAINVLQISNANEIEKVEIYGINGAIMSTEYNKNSELMIIDVADLASGVYLIKLYGTNEVAVSKFIKE
jgi:hypothetical protein